MVAKGTGSAKPFRRPIEARDFRALDRWILQPVGYWSSKQLRHHVPASANEVARSYLIAQFPYASGMGSGHGWWAWVVGMSGGHGWWAWAVGMGGGQPRLAPDRHFVQVSSGHRFKTKQSAPAVHWVIHTQPQSADVAH